MEALEKLLMILALVFSSALVSAADKKDTQVYSPGEKEYRDKATRLTSYETKVNSLEDQFEALVKAKNDAKDKATALEMIEEMKRISVERDDAVEKFNKLREEIHYKYPDKGRAVMRRFAPLQKKTVKQLEKRSTLDADLTSAKKAVDKVYRPFVRRAEEEEKKRLLERQQREEKSAKQSSESTGKIKKIRIEK